MLLFYFNKKVDQAISREKTIEINPNYYYGFNNLPMLLQKEEYEISLYYYDEAIKLNPKYTEAYNNRGNVFKIAKCR